MDNDISPKYIMELTERLEQALWNEFPTSKYKKVLFYIKKWHEKDDSGFNNYWENFYIYYKDDNQKEIDLNRTLNEMPSDLILKIAIDLWVETPDFIPCISVFKNDLKESYKTAFNSFEKALKQIEQNPDLAVSLANSTLESIIKHILQDENLSTKLNKNNTTYDLTQDILKEFKIFPNKESQDEIKVIWNWLLKACQSIEKLRSDKTLSHWKVKDDYIIEEPLYAYFIVNSVSTIWLFLMNFYKEKYKKEEKLEEKEIIIDEINIDDIPF